jgi:hypothetical protein
VTDIDLKEEIIEDKPKSPSKSIGNGKTKDLKPEEKMK